MPIAMNQQSTDENFSEDGYLAANADVAAVVASGTFESGFQHFQAFGRSEGRIQRNVAAIETAQKAKLQRLEPLLRGDIPHEKVGRKYNYLSDDLRQLSGIVDTTAVSSHDYDDNALKLIDELKDGLILDAGSGRRNIYYKNVVNLEIVDYDTTDILGVGEELPFIDNSFDAVISIAVLEHVKHPFRCAAEIKRVLKPGGKLYCSVPFLQPLHGYPHHYYNMTHQGLKALFEQGMQITGQEVLDSTSPIYSLTWILKRWIDELPELARNEMLEKKVFDLIGDPLDYRNESWVKEMTESSKFELASATVLHAIKD